MSLTSLYCYRGFLTKMGRGKQMLSLLQPPFKTSTLRYYATGPSTLKVPPKPKNFKPGAQIETKKASKEIEDRISAIPIENYRNFSIVAHVVSLAKMR